MITKLPTTASTKTTRNFTLSCTPKFLQTTLLSALFFLLLGVGESWGQTTFYSQDFETTNDWSYITSTTFPTNNRSYWAWGTGTAGALTGGSTGGSPGELSRALDSILGIAL